MKIYNGFFFIGPNQYGKSTSTTNSASKPSRNKIIKLALNKAVSDIAESLSKNSACSICSKTAEIDTATSPKLSLLLISLRKPSKLNQSFYVTNYHKRRDYFQQAQTHLSRHSPQIVGKV
jgi:hypothetical protein